jgi:uncharacterized membrane protein YqjE
MSTQASGTRQGLLASLSALAATFVAIVQTRLDLLSIDLEEERAHVFSLLVWMLAALCCLAIGLLLGALLLVAVFWDTHRLLVLGSLAGFFLVVGSAAWAVVRHKVNSKPRAFATTLGEFHKDRRQLSRP